MSSQNVIKYINELIDKGFISLSNLTVLLIDKMKHVDVDYIEKLLFDIMDVVFTPRQILRQVMMISVLQVK